VREPVEEADGRPVPVPDPVDHDQPARGGRHAEQEGDRRADVGELRGKVAARGHREGRARGPAGADGEAGRGLPRSEIVGIAAGRRHRHRSGAEGGDAAVRVRPPTDVDRAASRRDDLDPDEEGGQRTAQDGPDGARDGEAGPARDIDLVADRTVRPRRDRSEVGSGRVRPAPGEHVGRPRAPVGGPREVGRGDRAEVGDVEGDVDGGARRDIAGQARIDQLGGDDRVQVLRPGGLQVLPVRPPVGRGRGRVGPAEVEPGRGQGEVGVEPVPAVVGELVAGGGGGPQRGVRVADPRRGFRLEVEIVAAVARRGRVPELGRPPGHRREGRVGGPVVGVALGRRRAAGRANVDTDPEPIRLSPRQVTVLGAGRGIRGLEGVRVRPRDVQVGELGGEVAARLVHPDAHAGGRPGFTAEGEGEGGAAGERAEHRDRLTSRQVVELAEVGVIPGEVVRRVGAADRVERGHVREREDREPDVPLEGVPGPERGAREDLEIGLVPHRVRVAGDDHPDVQPVLHVLLPRGTLARQGPGDRPPLGGPGRPGGE